MKLVARAIHIILIVKVWSTCLKPIRGSLSRIAVGGFKTYLPGISTPQSFRYESNSFTLFKLLGISSTYIWTNLIRGKISICLFVCIEDALKLPYLPIWMKFNVQIIRTLDYYSVVLGKDIRQFFYLIKFSWDRDKINFMRTESRLPASLSD